jgi:restriction system protein
MSLWLVRAGRHGEQEETALKEGVVTIGWDRLKDLSGIKSKEELEKLYQETYQDEKKNKVGTLIGQVWTFVSKIKKDDLVALPLKRQAAIAIGKVDSEHYEYKELTDNVKHIRRVKWLKTIPRTAFDQDLLYSFGALLTVCEIKRNDAEKRVLQMLKAENYQKEPETSGESIADEEGRIDIEQSAQVEIEKYIDQKFKGHALSRLVEAVLKAQGYVTLSSDPGPDGGVDILAGAGPLGFDHPKICVQVKSSSSQADVKILRELQGVMTKVRAEQGLLVSWGGFNPKARQEARDAYFSLRLWDSGALLEAIFEHYDKFDDETKAELPLKRIWRLVTEE